ncbi:CRPV-309 [Crowpox virus]|nr:CRPV-309 [Crowpox virus]
MSTVITVFLIVLCYLIVFFITSSKVQYKEILVKSPDSFYVAKRFKSHALIENSPNVFETNSIST